MSVGLQWVPTGCGTERGWFSGWLRQQCPSCLRLMRCLRHALAECWLFTVGKT